MRSWSSASSEDRRSKTGTKRTEPPARSCRFTSFESLPIPNCFCRYSKTSVSLRGFGFNVSDRMSPLVATAGRVAGPAKWALSPEDHRTTATRQGGARGCLERAPSPNTVRSPYPQNNHHHEHQALGRQQHIPVLLASLELVQQTPDVVLPPCNRLEHRDTFLNFAPGSE